MEIILDEVKTILITGASTGIGEACALYLDSLGWHVIAGVRREEDRRRLIENASNQLEVLYLDLTEDDSIAFAAEQIRDLVDGRGLAGLINNAGIAVAGPLEFIPLGDLRRQLEVNVVGQVAITQAVLPLLRAVSGRIINVSSVSGRIAAPFFGPYAASKFAFEALSDAWRVELQPWGIAVVVIEPGSIATPIWEKSIAESDARIEMMPPEASDLYGKSMSYVRQRTVRIGDRGLPTDEVSKVVLKALTVPRPRARYILGKGTRSAIFLMSILPVKLRDRILAQQYGLTSKHMTKG